MQAGRFRDPEGCSSGSPHLCQPPSPRLRAVRRHADSLGLQGIDISTTHACCSKIYAITSSEPEVVEQRLDVAE